MPNPRRPEGMLQGGGGNEIAFGEQQLSPNEFDRLQPPPRQPENPLRGTRGNNDINGDINLGRSVQAVPVLHPVANIEAVPTVRAVYDDDADEEQQAPPPPTRTNNTEIAFKEQQLPAEEFNRLYPSSIREADDGNFNNINQEVDSLPTEIQMKEQQLNVDEFDRRYPPTTRTTTTTAAPTQVRTSGQPPRPMAAAHHLDHHQTQQQQQQQAASSHSLGSQRRSFRKH